ncbi:DUF3857 domain-containing protein [Christiangramia aquimixticola]|uniref:DUF3857 domain-containing protein n=1 Tax=Christiangramia aquimixticola TaxID=1697558 RepID=UPI003AA8CFE1
MNKFLGVFLFFSSLVSAQSSNYDSATEEVSIGDLKATNYAGDTLANAVYIYEKGFTEFDDNEDFDLVTKYAAKIKILNKDGMDAATIEIPLSKSSDGKKQVKIKDLKAYTYKLVNNIMTKKSLSPQNVFTKDNGNYDLKTFTFPDVAPGDVLYYSYKLVSPFVFDFKTWYFQEDIPKMHSEFTAKIPANYEYHTVLFGGLKLSSNDASVHENCISFNLTASMADCIETVYAMDDIPAFKEEEFMTSAINYKSRIEFELKQITRLDGYEIKYTKSWEDTDKEIRTSSNFGKQWKRDNLVDEILPEEIRALPNDLEKAKKIYYYVQENYNWNGKYNIHQEMNLKDIVKDHTGNVLAMNSLLHNLFDAEGFEVYPVMASTRNFGFPPRTHPVLSEFNYFFVHLNLDGKAYNLDVTENNLDFGRLPFRALNSYARLIDFENGSSWIDIEPETYSNYVFREIIEVQPNGTSTGESTHLLGGYHALRFRNMIAETSKENVFKNLSKPQSHTTTTKIDYVNLDDPEKQLQVKYELHNKSQKIEDLIYLNPFSFKFFQKHPFNLEKRTYPIDFGYKDSYMYSAIITIPENYSVTTLPEQKAFTLPGRTGALMFSATQVSENTINVQCRLNFKQAIYAPEYYEGLKILFNEIMAIQDHSLIVLKENS